MRGGEGRRGEGRGGKGKRGEGRGGKNRIANIKTVRQGVNGHFRQPCVSTDDRLLSHCNRSDTLPDMRRLINEQTDSEKRKILYDLN